MNDTIDLHGLFADQAEFELERKFQECVQYKINSLTVIYGKGEGILKNVVTKNISRFKNKIVRSTRDRYTDSILIEFHYAEIKPRKYERKSRIKVSDTNSSITIDTEKIRLKKLKGKEKYLKRMNKGKL